MYKEFKVLNKLLRRVIVKSDSLNVTQLDMTREESEDEINENPFRLEEIEALIKVDDERINQDKFKQIISKFYAVIRHKMYHKI